MKKIDIDNLKVSTKLDETINNAINDGYKNVSKGTKHKKTHNKFKKSIIAASLTVGILTTGVIATPAIAANIPIIGDIYKQLGFFNGFEDYTNYIGETKEVDGYKFTIDNLVGTPTDLLVGVKIESPIPFNMNKEQNLFEVGVDIHELNMNSMSGYVNSYYIDDHTVVVTTHMNSIEGKFKKLGDMEIRATYTDLTKEESEHVSTNFNIKVDFTSSFNKVSTIKVNKKLNETLKVNEIKSSVIGTKLILGPNVKGTNIEGRESWDGISDTLYLEIDGSLHGSYSSSSCNDVAMHDFPTVNYDDIKNAENINIIYLSTTNNDSVNFNGKVEMSIENGIEYPKEIVTEDGLQGRFYKFEQEGAILKAYFKSDYDILNALSSIVLFEKDENGKTVNIHNPKSCMNYDGSYVFEFDYVNLNNSLLIPCYSGVPRNGDYKSISIRVK